MNIVHQMDNESEPKSNRRPKTEVINLIDDKRLIPDYWKKKSTKSRTIIEIDLDNKQEKGKMHENLYEVNHEYNHKEILYRNNWILNISLNSGIENLQKVLTTNNINIADADVSTCVCKYVYGWE